MGQGGVASAVSGEALLTDCADGRTTQNVGERGVDSGGSRYVLLGRERRPPGVQGRWRLHGQVFDGGLTERVVDQVGDGVARRVLDLKATIGDHVILTFGRYEYINKNEERQIYFLIRTRT